MGTLSVRPIITEDIGLILNYLYCLNDEQYLLIGVDKSKLPNKEEFANNLRLICNTPLEKRKSTYIIWLLNNEPIGHVAIKDIINGEIAHIHLHLWKRESRGKGYGAKLFCMSILNIFKELKLKMMLCEPSVSNPTANKMLTKIGFKIWKTYVSTSTEISLTRDLNSYIIDPTVAINYLNEHPNVH